MSSATMTKKPVLGEDCPSTKVLQLHLSRLKTEEKACVQRPAPANREEFDDMWDNVPV